MAKWALLYSTASSCYPLFLARHGNYYKGHFDTKAPFSLTFLLYRLTSRVVHYDAETSAETLGTHAAMAALLERADDTEGICPAHRRTPLCALRRQGNNRFLLCSLLFRCRFVKSRFDVAVRL